MERPSQPFDKLPVEIIRRIASFCPCSTIIALSKTNHFLHRTCYDPVVFHSAILNRESSDSGVAVWRGCNDLEKWHPDIATQDSPRFTTSWARYALADEKSTSLGSQRAWSHYHRGSGSTWVPQLIALKHPFVKRLSLRWLGDYLECNFYEIDYEFTASFCLSALLIHEDTEPLRALDLIKSMVSLATGVLKYHIHNPGEAHVNKERNVALVGVGLLAFYLRRMLKHHEGGNDSWLRATLFTPPPATSHIPFASMMNLSLPFQPGARQRNPTCHLPIMAGKAFLEEGVWEGYYAYCFDRSPYLCRFDPPMKHLRLRCTEESTDDVQFFEGSGSDNVGRFSLSGWIHVESGKIVAKKQYSLYGVSWDWSAFMTPFGIAGTWGEIEYGGWLWLWKADWIPSSG